MPKTFLPWLRGSVDLNSEPKKPVVKPEVETDKPVETKTESKTEAKKTSGLNKLRGNK